LTAIVKLDVVSRSWRATVNSPEETSAVTDTPSPTPRQSGQWICCRCVDASAAPTNWPTESTAAPTARRAGSGGRVPLDDGGNVPVSNTKPASVTSKSATRPGTGPSRHLIQNSIHTRRVIRRGCRAHLRAP
jgi:hypothetical protein